MNNEKQNQIKKLLEEYVAKFPSQAKAAKTFNNVSEATIISVLKDKPVSEEMWTRIAKQVGYNDSGRWNLVETSNFKKLNLLYEDARQYQNTFAIVGVAGSGKTAFSRQYSLNNPNAYHIQCSEYMNRKAFMEQLAERMGMKISGTINYYVARVVDHINKSENPIIILDEADKLSDQVLYFFITLYNMLEGKCAIILLATDYLATRIDRGRRLNKKGYAEIFSRVGRKFIGLPETEYKDVQTICNNNGVTDPNQITFIYNECEGDLRRVERAIHKHKVSTKRSNVA